MWCTSLLPAQDITFSWCILYWLSHLCFLQDASRNHCNYQLHCSRLRTHGCYHCCCWHLGKIRPRKAQGLWADARRCVDLPGYAENQNSIQVTQCSAYSGLWLLGSYRTKSRSCTGHHGHRCTKVRPTTKPGILISQSSGMKISEMAEII